MTPAGRPPGPEAPLAPAEGRSTTAPVVPRYLQDTYWWAYVHPRAVTVFERDWLVGAILFGHYGRLRDAALDALGPAPLAGRTLQVACAYGNLTPRLQQRLAPQARLDVVDILPVQLQNLRGKLAPDARVTLRQGDSAALDLPEACCEQVLLFFLLHEQPEAVRRATLAEAVRVLKPGGRLVIVDYHRPAAWHPLRLLMRGVYAWLEPFAIDLWRAPLTAFLPQRPALRSTLRRTWFGGLYQLEVFERAAAGEAGPGPAAGAAADTA